MNNPQNFLITYGLHNFVTHAQKKKKHTFFIRGQESQTMIGHATHLIKESYGETTDIQMV